MQKKYFTTNTKTKLVYCPLNSLIPDGIKKEYLDNLNKDIIPRTQYYNDVSNILGYTSWLNYKKEFENKLKLFMKKNGLINYCKNLEIDLINTYYPFNFKYRDISDRFFLSNKELPKAIFTGYRNTYLEENMTIILAHNAFLFDEYDLDITMETAIHLIGDLCLKNEVIYRDELFFQLYDENGLIIHEESHKKILKEMKQWLLKQKDGWIEIIPYNENLIFLKSNDGLYDFIFKGLRDNKFISPFEGFLKSEDTPSIINEKYDFQFWLYYGRKNKKEPIDYLWKEKDEHLSAIEFYKNNTLKNFRSITQSLKDYYKNNNLYSYSINKSKHHHEKYELIEFEDNKLCISPLITIAEFFEFYNNEYKDKRSDKLEELYSVNFERPDYPVSVTWYDAVAYCKHLQNKYKKSFRLLTSTEFKVISPNLESDNENELTYFYENQEFYEKPNVENYENLLLRFKEPLEFITKGKLNFPINSRFKEWSNEFNDNNHVNLLSASKDNYSYELPWNALLASSTNKYKHLKVGFRVCYELSKDEL